MRRFLFLFVLFLPHSVLFAGDLVLYPEANSAFPLRMLWAFQNAADRSSFWMGYSVSRLMYPDETFMSGVSINGDFRFNSNKPTLQEWISGIQIVPKREIKDQAQNELNRLENRKKEKIWKEIGIFQKFERRQKIPEEICVIDMTVPHSFDASLYWLGHASDEESFQYLSGEYEHLENNQKKEDLLAAIVIHPPALSFPFLRRILEGKEAENVQESAAVFMGELDTPEALVFLQEVAGSNPWKDVREGAVVGISEMDNSESLKVITQIAISSSDKDLRETAMAMLSDKHDPLAFKTLEHIAWFDSSSDMRETAIAMLAETEEGVPVLLKIMDEHPSKETREVAVQMLAETIAGREVLKKKVKQ
jgi:hypothetical protein